MANKWTGIGFDTGITIGYAASTSVSAPVESEVAERYKHIEQMSRTQVAAGETISVESSSRSTRHAASRRGP